MEQVKKMIRCNEIGRRVNDQFYVDDDVNVPDAKSDVGRVVLSEGSVKVEDIRLTEHYIRVTGKISYQILYSVENEGQRMSSLQGKLPFEEMVYMEEEPKAQLFVKSASAEMSVTVIHSRKLNVKAAVELEIGSEGEREEALTMDMEDTDQVYKKFNTRELLKLHASKKDIYRIKEEVKLPGTKENIGTLLFSECALRKLDTRLGTDELLLRGEIQVFCLYESMEEKADWVEQTVPFEGKVDCYGADDTMYHYLYADLVDNTLDVRMDEDGEMRIFGVEAVLEIRYTVYEEEKMEVLEDLYALNKELQLKTEPLELESLVMQNHSKCKLTEQLSLPELKDTLLQICHSSGNIQVESTELVPEGIRIEGVLNVCFLYIKADDEMPFDVWQGMVPFSHVIENSEIGEDMKYDIGGTLEQLGVGLLGNEEVEVKAVLSFQIFLRRPVKLANIVDVEAVPLDKKEMENAPGIIGYIVKDGDDMWSLAKKYHTTEEGIREVNDLENTTLRTGDRILIFKENMSIL